MDREKGLFAAVVGTSLFAYLATASRFVLGGDSGEFVMLFAKGGGVAHPPGYPLYTMILRAMAWMPGENAAEASSRVTALLGVLAVVAVHFAARSWGASYLAACVAAAAWALLPLTWKMAVHAEVFALHALVSALVIGVCGPKAPWKGGKRIAALGLCAAAGLANHPLVVSLFPIGVVALVRAFGPERARLRGAVAGLAALSLVVVPYAFLAWSSHQDAGRWIWRGPMSAHDVWLHFLRADYFVPRDGAYATVTQEPWLHWPDARRVGEQLASILEEVPGVVVLLACVGAGALVLRRPRLAAVEGAVLVATFVVAGPWMNALHALRPVGIGRAIEERFYVIGQMIPCVALALGVDFVLARLRRRALAAAILCAAFLARGLIFVRGEVVEYTRPTVELYARNTLKGLPPRAVLVGTGDHRFFSMLVLQRAYGMRTDVAYVDGGMLGNDWYRARAQGETGIAWPPPDGPPIARNLIDAALATGRPVFVADHAARLARDLPSYPHGTVTRVLEPRTLGPDPYWIEDLNAKLFDEMEREATKPKDKWGWAGDLDDTYANAWEQLAATYDTLGMKERAQACRARIR